jgi:hypothetical protein
MPFSPELLDVLLKDYKNPNDLLGETGCSSSLPKALVERALNGELTQGMLAFAERLNFQLFRKPSDIT